jgi:hypothetical protein
MQFLEDSWPEFSLHFIETMVVTPVLLLERVSKFVVGSHAEARALAIACEVVTCVLNKNGVRADEAVLDLWIAEAAERVGEDVVALRVLRGEFGDAVSKDGDGLVGFANELLGEQMVRRSIGVEGFIVEGKFHLAMLRRAVEQIVTEVIMQREGRGGLQRWCLVLSGKQALLASRGFDIGQGEGFWKAVEMFVLGHAYKGAAGLARGQRSNSENNYFHEVLLRGIGKMRDDVAGIDSDDVAVEFREELRKLWDVVLQEVMAHGLQDVILCESEAGRVFEVVERAPKIEKVESMIPSERQAIIHDFLVGAVEGELVVGMKEDRQLTDVRLRVGEPGSDVDGLAESLGGVMTLALRNGVKIEDVVQVLRGAGASHYLSEWLKKHFCHK